MRELYRNLEAQRITYTTAAGLLLPFWAVLHRSTVPALEQSPCRAAADRSGRSSTLRERLL